MGQAPKLQPYHYVSLPPRQFLWHHAAHPEEETVHIEHSDATREPGKPVTMRLTAELIRDSLSYLNPLKERELDLRGAFPKRAECYT